jgi:zinc and cadmium transporter
MLSSLTTIPGAVIAYFYLGQTLAAVPFILAISAASFIYIAVADLVPTLHREIGLRPSLIQFSLILAGIATIAVFSSEH